MVICGHGHGLWDSSHELLFSWHLPGPRLALRSWHLLLWLSELLAVSAGDQVPVSKEGAQWGRPALHSGPNPDHAAFLLLSILPERLLPRVMVAASHSGQGTDCSLCRTIARHPQGSWQTAGHGHTERLVSHGLVRPLNWMGAACSFLREHYGLRFGRADSPSCQCPGQCPASMGLPWCMPEDLVAPTAPRHLHEQRCHPCLGSLTAPQVPAHEKHQHEWRRQRHDLDSTLPWQEWLHMSSKTYRSLIFSELSLFPL